MKSPLSRIAAACLLGGFLAGCTSGQSSGPGFTPVNPLTTNVLQFAVGTANIGSTGTIGLNTVVTLRQPNGLDGTLLNQPIITGPAGFLNTGSATGSCSVASPTTTGVAQPSGAGTDAGTNQITGSPQPLPAGSFAICTTLGTSGGAFGFGFQPANSTTAAGVSFGRYSLPAYTASANQLPYIGGPPQFPQARDGTFPSGFQGYPMGFTDFNVPPVLGTYNLNVVIPTGFNSANVATFGNLSANGTLNT
ncbi:MAG: hypothetical protein GIW95_04570, partial [Candidatus Eremiobacteraeota bacterium]|nr:hypothetical protein [Candidatus Eremiobacteraeota bacterium]